MLFLGGAIEVETTAWVLTITQQSDLERGKQAKVFLTAKLAPKIVTNFQFLPLATVLQILPVGMDLVCLPTDAIRLAPHPTARSKAVATTHLPVGSVIITIPSVVTVLLASEKGRRCDTCFRLTSEQCQLRRCTGCASYWYCDMQCLPSDIFTSFIARLIYIIVRPDNTMDSPS